ncbi:MAG TPA: hypothetical protein VJ836_04810 [Candidatus Saccharimonadales bacterium]|nr:hypothetical protein [Candidatus Saccharimonadales bacterium]
MPILTSNANFVPTSFYEARLLGIHGAPFLTLAGLAELTEAIGADGIEYMPVRSPSYVQLLEGGSQSLDIARKIIQTGHQNFGGLAQERPNSKLQLPGHALLGEPKRPGLSQRLGERVLTPQGTQSLERLQTIAKRLGKANTMSCIIFPDPFGYPLADRSAANRFPAGAFVQHTPDVVACWGIDPRDTKGHEAYAIQLRRRNVRGVLPTFHGGRIGKIVGLRLNEEAYRDYLLNERLIGEVHVEVGRIEFAKLDPERVQTSRTEAIRLMRGDQLNGLPLHDHLDALRDARWAGNVVVESAIPGVVDALSHQGIPLSYDAIIKAHRDINNNLRQELPYIN